MGSFSNYLENKVLDHIFKTASFTVPTNICTALSTADPLDTGAGIAEPVGNVFERGVARIAGDRKHAAERSVQALIGALFRRRAFLKEFLVRVELDRQQIGHFQNARKLAEILPNPLLFGKRIRH